MKITSIKQQIKRQGRYSIFIEGEYICSLSETALLESKLYSGQDLSEAEVGQLKQSSIDDKIYNNALSFAMLRPRSFWEMQQYLQRKKCSPSLSDSILNKLSKIGILDDEKFARSWVTNRRLLKPTSRHKLIQELRIKHVSESVAKQVIDEDETNDQTVLKELIVRKRKQTRYQDEKKLMQYLAGQGFNYGDIKETLDELSIN